MKNKAIIHLILMLFATAFASCTDEDFLAGELQGTQLADSREVKIVATETDWQGQTVSLTRAGETLEQLKASSERTWDFTKTPLMDLGVLKADAAKTDGKKWSYDDVKKQFESQSAFTTLQANGVPLYMTEGLTFSGVTSEEGALRIDVDGQLKLNKQGICITLPSLEKGQKVTVKFSSTGSNSRNIIPGGNVSSIDAVTSNSTTPVTCEVTMTANGSPTFTVGEGTNGSSVYIYSISVSRAESDGFGLYSDSERLQVSNSHIVWDSDIQSWKGISNDAYLMLWPNNIVKSNVSFTRVDGKVVQSNPDYYTLSETRNYHEKFTGCTYDGITFTEGLKMEYNNGTPTTISFTNKAVGTVTIVQSDWESDEKPHGTPKTIQFDDSELEVASAEAITGGRVYTLKNIAAGTHTITRGSGESGIFYVALDIPFTAYAPYISDTSLPVNPNNVPADYYGIVSLSRNLGELVFKPYKDNRIDLMYADHRTTNDGVVELDFKHALGKLSIGTIYNNYGDNITLTQIKLTSSHFCEKGTLNLHTGEWTENEVNPSYEETYGPELALLFGTLDIPDKGKLTFPKDVAYTQIPGTTLSFEYTFETDNHTTFSVTKEITIEKGKNIFVNINIGQNHEVVIE